jgi:lysyl-tRNA synthetase class I
MSKDNSTTKTLSMEEIMAALIEEEKESKVSPFTYTCSNCKECSPTFTKETDGEQWFSIHECA